MGVTHVFAGIPVADFEAARAWYERFAARPPDLVPHSREAAWQLTESGWIYVVADAGRAGSALVTVLVDDLDERIAGLRERGLEVGEVETIADGVRKVAVHDPDGNAITLGQPPPQS
ncbi:MAG: VOC family protein [Actinomycetota bacterium]|nr:VOC family protein [Actinomycetota bacterium]